MITEARNKGNQDFKKIVDIVKEEKVKVVPLKKENVDKIYSRNNNDVKKSQLMPMLSSEKQTLESITE